MLTTDWLRCITRPSRLRRRGARSGQQLQNAIEQLEDRALLTAELASVVHPLFFSGSASASGESTVSAISADGRYVVFTSDATDLVPNDDNDAADVFRYDRITGDVELVSVTTNGLSPGNGVSLNGRISADGSKIVFLSQANNLQSTAVDGNAALDVYVRDMINRTTTLVSVTEDGRNAGEGVSDFAVISEDGNSVAFTSTANNLLTLDGDIDTDPALVQDVFVRNLVTRRTLLASVNSQGTGSGNALSHSPSISADGKRVAFSSQATNLNLFDEGFEVYVYDVATQSNTLVSHSSIGTTPGNGDADRPLISADGKVVAFSSNSTDLVSQTLTADATFENTFTYNLTTRTMRLASINTNNNGGGNRSSRPIDLSDDGTAILFWTTAANIHPLDHDFDADYFVRDTRNGTTHLISVNSMGNDSGNDISDAPSSIHRAMLSADGNLVVFDSRADNLHPDDDDGGFAGRDVFVRDIAAATTTLVSREKTNTTSGNAFSLNPIISRDGQVVAFDSLADDLVVDDENELADVFVVFVGDDELPARAALVAPAGNIADTTPEFLWEPVTGASHYDLWVDNRSTGAEQVVRQQSLTTTSYVTPTTLAPGNYRAWVRAINSRGAGEWSRWSDFTVIDQSQPPGRAKLTGPEASSTASMPTFSWNTVSNAAQYDLWVNNLSTGAEEVIREQNLTSTTFTAEAELPPGNYRAWVRAVNDAGPGDWSPWRNFTILATETPPAQPVLTGPIGTTSDVTPSITWNAVADADHYDVWVDNRTTGQSQVIRDENVVGTSLTSAVELTPGTYRAWVRAVSASGLAGEWSSFVSFSVTTAGLPGKPTLTAPTGTITDTTPTFSWQAVANTQFYDLWVNSLSTGVEQIIREQSLMTATFTATTVLPAGNYRVWVRAINDAGPGPWSGQRDFTIADALFAEGEILA